MRQQTIHTALSLVVTLYISGACWSRAEPGEISDDNAPCSQAALAAQVDPDTATAQVQDTVWHPSDVSQGVSARGFYDAATLQFLVVRRLGEMGGVSTSYRFASPSDYMAVREEWEYDRPIYEQGARRRLSSVDTLFFCDDEMIFGRESFREDVRRELSEALARLRADAPG